MPIRDEDQVKKIDGKGTRIAKIIITKREKKTRAAGEEVPAGGDPDDEGAGDGDEEDYDVSLSSEQPVDRWFGREILVHSPDAVNLERAQNGLPLLDSHDGRTRVGRLTNLKPVGSKLTGKARFSKIQAGRDAKTLADEGHHEMSIGYQVDEYEVTPGKGDAPPTYRATKWTPLEGSMASVPADHTVGFGRSNSDKVPVIRHLQPEKSGTTPGVTTMPDPVQPADPSKVAAEIVRRAKLHGVPDKAAEWLEQGLTIDQVNERILEIRATPPVKQPPAELDLTEREAKEYSYCRAILAAAEGEKAAKSFELEISTELERTMPTQYKRRGGVMIPTSLRGLKGAQGQQARGRLNPAQVAALNDALTRAGVIDSVTVNAIKEVVFTVYGGELIEFLRNQARVVEMGARVLTGLSSPIAFPRQTADSSAFWVAEDSGADVTASNVTTDLVTLSPKTLMATTAYSRQLLVQASIDVEAMVRASIGYSHALAWDLAAVHGTGAGNQPLGVYNQTGVSVEDFSTYSTANQLNYPQLIDMTNKVASANALLGALGWLTNPGTAASALGKLKFPTAAIAQGQILWEGSILEGQMLGYKARATNQISKTMLNLASTGGAKYGLVFGNWSDLLIGQFGGAMELIVDPYSKKKQGLIEVASFQMCDVEVRHGPSFCVAKNLDSTL